MSSDQVLARFLVNGRMYEVSIPPNRLLLDMLREELGLTGTKRGCDDGSCGACTIIVEGEPMLACMMLALAYYWNQHAKTQATIQGEWVYTGDRYSQDAEGYFWFQGRSDEMFKVNGQWVSPLEVEAVLHQHPAVAEAAVVQGLDGDGLVKPKAFVVLNSGYQPSDALITELQSFARQYMAPHQYPRWIHFRADLPRTATGKLQRYKLAQESRERAVRRR